jgi:hypothetical protein
MLRQERMAAFFNPNANFEALCFKGATAEWVISEEGLRILFKNSGNLVKSLR